MWNRKSFTILVFFKFFVSNLSLVLTDFTTSEKKKEAEKTFETRVVLKTFGEMFSDFLFFQDFDFNQFVRK